MAGKKTQHSQKFPKNVVSLTDYWQAGLTKEPWNKYHKPKTGPKSHKTEIKIFSWVTLIRLYTTHP